MGRCSAWSETGSHRLCVLDYTHLLLLLGALERERERGEVTMCVCECRANVAALLYVCVDNDDVVVVRWMRQQTCTFLVWT